MKSSTQNGGSSSPILIPTNSYLEGYLKSHKSLRIECNFKGAILTQKKVIIESTSVVIGVLSVKIYCFQVSSREIFFVLGE
jgi:cytoskeletal protein CcmA (bactofilin family)